ncbi:unnamed protein product [Protopolystoma xenopodis]|uniref:Uncharacterized protein n=1 Tax=Protopolystoma xenopodis TaxID=117903 RepID=A0A448XKY3_9PLAT|nr:unnamed protein product [Protopolystoma xenopodis]
MVMSCPIPQVTDRARLRLSGWKAGWADPNSTARSLSYFAYCVTPSLPPSFASRCWARLLGVSSSPQQRCWARDPKLVSLTEASATWAPRPTGNSFRLARATPARPLPQVRNEREAPCRVVLTRLSIASRGERCMSD